MTADAERDSRLAGALRPYLEKALQGVLLAVSGGPDSTALMHASSRFGATVYVATVDHGLRPDSANEAASVGEAAARLGLPHRVLRWAAPRSSSAIQAAARDARYALLAEHARALGADAVLTGHTADDQAETVLMRLIAGSGPSGLAGMRRERALGEGVRLVRPFLNLPKSDLVAYCEEHGLPFVRDPSNANDRFARVRLRRLMPKLAAEGLSPLRLQRLAARLARDEDALQHESVRLLDSARRPSPSGEPSLDGPTLASAPEALALRALDIAITDIASGLSQPVPSRLERLERLVLDGLLPALHAGAAFRATLRGVSIEARCNGELRLLAAPPRRSARAHQHSPSSDSLASARAALLGNADPAAYIGRESVE